MRKTLIPLSLVVVALVASAVPAAATPGGVDTTFGNGGRFQIDLGSSHDEAWKLVQQPDDKLLAIGFANPNGDYDIAVVRTTADGVADTTFGGGDGVVLVDVTGNADRAFGGVVQPNGAIVVAGEGFTDGEYRMVAVRLEPDGDLDTTFSGDGTVIVPQFATNSIDAAKDVVLQSGGRLVVGGSTTSAGNTNFALAGLESDGDIDTTFGGGDGEVTADVGAGGDDSLDELTLGPSDSVIATGKSDPGDIALTKFEADGDPDVTFGGGDGVVITDVGGLASGNGVGIQPGTGRIIVAGRAGYTQGEDYVTLGYEPDGDLDPTFGGGDGIVTTALGPNGDLACAVAFQADGSILVGGDSFQKTYDYGLVRYTPSGVLDTTFGNNGIRTTDFAGGTDLTYGLVVTASGQIVQAGYSSETTQGGVDITMFRYDGATVPANPDAEVMRVGKPPALGAGVFNWFGGEQTAKAKVHRGKRVRFELTVTNRGTASDTVTVDGSGGNAKWGVTYTLDGTDVSHDVVQGSMQPLMAPGEDLVLVARVRVPERGKIGLERAFLLRATSGAEPLRSDTVAFVARLTD